MKAKTNEYNPFNDTKEIVYQYARSTKEQREVTKRGFEFLYSGLTQSERDDLKIAFTQIDNDSAPVLSPEESRLDIDYYINSEFLKPKIMALTKKAEVKETAKKVASSDAVKQPAIYIEGIFIFQPNAGAPKHIKGNVVLSINRLSEWLEKEGKQYIQDNEKYGPQVKLDLCERENGALYLKVNTYKK